jgi:hypothetical protein
VLECDATGKASFRPHINLRINNSTLPTYIVDLSEPLGALEFRLGESACHCRGRVVDGFARTEVNRSQALPPARGVDCAERR